MQDPRIAFLRDLGIPDSQARAYLALAALDKGTAREVSERARVPRTQVYALLDALEQVGLVERAGDAFAARSLHAFLEHRLETLESRREGLLDAREDLLTAFTPAETAVTGDEMRLLRGSTRPAEVLAQWLDSATTSLVAAFSATTLTDTLKDPELGPAFTDALTRLPHARIILHGTGTGSRLGILPPHVIAVTRVARPEDWHCDRVVLDDARVMQRLSLGPAALDGRTPYLALASTHEDIVADARAVLALAWARATPALDVLGLDASHHPTPAEGES